MGRLHTLPVPARTHINHALTDYIFKLLNRSFLTSFPLPLQTAVDEWNPLTDTVPIHTWLHPWLPWFGSASRLAPVHEVVLHKLAQCLNNWHPSDSSASSVLLPWRNVLPMTEMAIFLNRNIVPKLALVMQTFQVRLFFFATL